MVYGTLQSVLDRGFRLEARIAGWFLNQTLRQWRSYCPFYGTVRRLSRKFHACAARNSSNPLIISGPGKHRQEPGDTLERPCLLASMCKLHDPRIAGRVNLKSIQKHDSRYQRQGCTRDSGNLLWTSLAIGARSSAVHVYRFLREPVVCVVFGICLFCLGTVKE